MARKKCKRGLKLYKVTSDTQKMKPRKICAKSPHEAKRKIQKASSGNLIATFMSAERIK